MQKSEKSKIVKYAENKEEIKNEATKVILDHEDRMHALITLCEIDNHDIASQGVNHFLCVS